MPPSLSSRGERPPDAEPLPLRELFRAHGAALLGFLVRKVGTADAPDLLQETFLRVIRHARPDTIADPPAFLKQVAINLARDFARRRRTEETYLRLGDYLVDPPSRERPVEERIDYERRSALLEGAVAALPPRRRLVFELHVYHDLPLTEVAARMEISDRMARKHLSAALKACRAALRSAAE